jgi:preprotein translocase subunit SecE
MQTTQSIILALIGMGIIYLGLDAGLGGIRTLGWQASPDFVTVTDEGIFAAQDSHARFFGGVWFAVGLVFLGGAVLRRALAQTVIVLCLVIALAGLFRLSQGLSAVANPAVLPSFLLEILGFPALALWLHRTRHAG